MIGRTQYAYIRGPLRSAFTRYGRNISPHDRAGSLPGCRGNLVGLSRRGRLRFLTPIQHDQPDHQETCQEKDYLKLFRFAIHLGLLLKSFPELNLVQRIYDDIKFEFVKLYVAMNRITNLFLILYCSHL